METGIPTSFAEGRFLIERELGKGGMGIVYEALDTERNMRVALKTLHHMNSDNVYYFKNEFRALHDLVHPNLCSLMELIQDNDVWFLTMELIHGLDFLSYIENSNPKTNAPPLFDESKLIKSLVGLCEGLGALHSAGKVHRDIKPSNVLITEDDRVVLLDFGLVTEKDIKNQTMVGLVGSPAYMAPEQVESEMVGPEADCYAVGVMLYEALTGNFPYSGSPLNIIMEKQLSDPIRPSETIPGLPEDLEMLCMDLLNRDPKARPLASEILDIIQVNKSAARFSIAANLTTQTQGSIFVGRQAELQLLREAYQKTLEGSFESVIIEGVSGVGKSTLTEYFSTELMSNDPSPVILKGRCYERETAPFKAFDGVIEALVRHIKQVPIEQAVELEPRNAGLLIRLFPGLLRSELFANIPLPDIQIEDPHELQSRSFDAFKDVLFRLRNQRPLIIIIDDIQWADTDSISLLKQLVNNIETPPMLLILLSRFAKHEKDSVMDWDALVSIHQERIHLRNLDEKDSKELVRQYVNREQASIDVDAESIALEAAGHPLYIAELVHRIAEGGETWRNLRIDEVISSRVKTLPKNARQVLRIICVAGSPIESGHLQILTQMQPQDFFNIIALLRTTKLLCSRGPRKNHIIEPYHDRVREAVVAHDLSVSESSKINLEIGRFFQKLYSEEELEENIFDVIHYLHAGKDLITEESEKLRLAELLFLAGKNARDSAAFASSLVYFKESIQLFSEELWEPNYDMLFELYCAAAESAYITGDFSLTKKLVEKARLQARSNVDKAKIYETYILSLVADGKPVEAINKAIDVIAVFGVKLPTQPTKLHVLIKILGTYLRLYGKKEDDLIGLPHNTNEQIVSAKSLMAIISPLTHSYRPNLNALMVLKTVELSLKYGIDYTSPYIFVAWGFINCVFLNNYREGYKYGRISMNMLEQFKNSREKAKTTFVWATFVQHWIDHIRKTLPYLQKSHEMADKIGDLAFLGWSGANYCQYSFFSGENLHRLEDKFVNYGKEIEYKKQGLQYNGNRIFFQTVLNLMGRSQNPTKLSGTAYDETKMVSHHTEKDERNTLSQVYFCELLLRVFFNSYRDAYKSSLEIKKYVDAAGGTYRLAILPFYDSLACLKYHDEADRRTQRKILRRVRKNQRKYKKIALASPANHAHKYTLVEAERARVKRKYKKAPALYDEAIAGAIEQEFTQDAALACEFAADFYREIGDAEKTMSYARDALSHYEKWGAFAKVEHVKEKFALK